MWDSVHDYAEWFLRQPFNMLRGARHEVYHFGPVVAFTVHREPPFQVELVQIMAGTGGFGEHTHPHAEGLEFPLFGEVHLTVHGKPVWPPALVRRFAQHPDRYTIPPVHIPAGVPHGAPVGEAGGAFLSVQRWTTTPLTTVGLDWEGAPMDALHARAIGLEVTP